MRANDGTRTAAEVLVDQLVVHGVRHVFCVPGESYLAALDALHNREIAVTVCRQEGGAAMMAEAVGKFTGRPGVCFTTRGPGASNASPGIRLARLPYGDERPARPGGGGAAGGHAHRPRRRCRCPAVRAGGDVAGLERHG